MSDNDFTKFIDLTDDIGIPIFGVRMLVYVDTEGRNQLAWEREGTDVTAFLAVGALESMKAEIFHQHMHEQSDG